jgi:hypothetical protein
VRNDQISDHKIEADLRTALLIETRDTEEVREIEVTQTNPGIGPVTEAITVDETETITDHKIVTDHGIITGHKIVADGVMTDVQEVTVEGDITTEGEIGRRTKNPIATNGHDKIARRDLWTIPAGINVETTMITTVLGIGIVQQTDMATIGSGRETTAGVELHFVIRAQQLHN